MVTALAPALFDQVEEALKDVVDPELGVNIVDLGLIYDLSWDDEQEALVISADPHLSGLPAHRRARGADGRIARRCRRAIPHQLGVDAAVGSERITDDGRDMMRALGFSI